MVVPGHVLVICRQLLGVKLEAADIEPIAAAAGIIVWQRYLRDMRRHERVKRVERHCGILQKVSRLSRRNREYAVAGVLREDSAIARAGVVLNKLLVGEEEERLVLSTPVRGFPSPKLRKCIGPPISNPS